MRIGISHICISEVGNANTQTISMAEAALVGDALLAIIVYITMTRRSRMQSLLRDGVACRGTILDRRWKLTRSSINHFVKFQFVTPDGFEITKEDRITYKAYKAVIVGEPITVLYDSSEPTQCLAYDCCNYEVVSLVG